MSEVNSLEEITETNPMQREMNKGLMVAYINRYLVEGTGSLDVRTSFVYYDADKDFVIATNHELGGPGAEAAFEKLGVKYYSKGIV